MQKLYILIAIIGLTAVQTASAQPTRQPIKPASIMERLEIHPEKGITPRNFEDMVGTSAIIVKGRFGKLLSHQKFWGYSDTRESFQQRTNLPDKDVDQFGLPRSEYEIIIDEVLLGDIDSDQIVFRTLESDPSDRRLTGESVERLFFLNLDPDGQGYSKLGFAYILNNRNGVYSYNDFDGHIDKMVSKTLLFAPTMRVEVIDQIIRDEVRRMNSDN